jgi:hypothetical protein
MSSKKTTVVNPTEVKKSQKAAVAKPTVAKASKKGATTKPTVAKALRNKNDNSPLYAFRIELIGLTPLVWREFYLPAATSLADFHQAIADVMGWGGGHLYSFSLNGRNRPAPYSGKEVLYFCPGSSFYSDEEDDGEFSDLDQISLESLGLEKDEYFYYVYDLGDCWEHVITVKDLDHVPKETTRRLGCLAGERACPPDDCGGVEGYENLLKILANPKHKEFQETVDWLRDIMRLPNYDPEKFSVAQANLRLRR